jgi:hypothetical protein
VAYSLMLRPFVQSLATAVGTDYQHPERASPQHIKKGGLTPPQLVSRSGAYSSPTSGEAV